MPFPSTCGGTVLNLHTTSLLLRITDNQTGVTVDDFASVYRVIEISMISTFAICSPRDWTGLSSIVFRSLECPGTFAAQLIRPFCESVVAVKEAGGDAIESEDRKIRKAGKVVSQWPVSEGFSVGDGCSFFNGVAKNGQRKDAFSARSICFPLLCPPMQYFCTSAGGAERAVK